MTIQDAITGPQGEVKLTFSHILDEIVVVESVSSLEPCRLVGEPKNQLARAHVDGEESRISRHLKNRYLEVFGKAEDDQLIYKLAKLV